MRFLFVDQIAQRGREEVHGNVRLGPLSPLRYARFGGGAVVAPGAISEGIGQLASWLCLERNEFAARPVFLFADEIASAGEVPAGSTVELSAALTGMDEETFVFSGEARFGGKVVQTIRNCNGYFMPLAELEDPAATRRRFAALIAGGLRQTDDEGPEMGFSEMLHGVDERVAGEELWAKATFAPELPFYRDHFPRFPVTPIVVLNEVIGAAARRLLAPRGDGPVLRVRRIADIKIRSFVRPGETVEARIKVEARDGARIRTVTDLLKDGKRILRGHYEYELTEQP